MGYHSKLTIKRRTIEINRRQFVLSALAAGGGLTVGLSPAGDAFAAIVSPKPWTDAEGTGFTAFLSIAPDNIITVRSTTPDIGNGTFTAAPSMVMEELSFDWDLVRGEFIDPNTDLKAGGAYSKAGTLAYFSGRSTSPQRLEELLQLAASTRERLRMAAAEEWGIDVSEVTAEKSILSGGGKTATYGEMAEKAAAIELAEEPTPKPRSEWTFLGKESPKKLQLAGILNGSIQYGIDVQVPGMIYAALRQVPAQGGRLKSYDFDAVKDMPGVRGIAVVDPDEVRPGLPEGIRPPFGMAASTNGPQAAVAIFADHYWQALTALDLMPIEWDLGEGEKWTKTQTYYDALSERLANPVDPNISTEQGDVAGQLASGDIIEEEYLTPYMDHFNMEPLNGTALVETDRVEMWMPSQHTQQALYLAADETGVHPDNVFVNQTWVGTGLGRRVYGDDARMVAAVARQMPGVPVKVIWSREESMRQGRYRQAIAARVSGKLGADGSLETLKLSMAGAGANDRGLVNSPYKLGIPNYLVQTQNVNSNLYTGPWRGPNWNSNCFILESFINQCAETAGIDPIEYRKNLLAGYEDAAWIKLLDVVKEKSGWGTDQGRGIAQGVAIGNWGMATSPEKGPMPFTGTTVAAVVTAEVSRRGDIYIPRVDIAMDTGSYINQEAVRLMMEGGVNLGIGAALHEEINIDHGKVVEGNLDTYRLLRQNDPALPTEIHVHFEGMSGHERFSEVGEPPMGPPPAALAHAIFKITGKWLRRIPFDSQEIV